MFSPRNHNPTNVRSEGATSNYHLPFAFPLYAVQQPQLPVKIELQFWRDYGRRALRRVKSLEMHLLTI